MTDIPSIDLCDGNRIPQIGFGVWQVPDAEAPAAIAAAIDAGYRMIDSAMIYRNETGVGRAVAASPVPRSELFITTKLWNDDQGFDSTLRAFDASMKRLGIETLDLYLIHWPTPAKDRYVDTFKAMVRLQAEGRVRSIGVSNFMAPHLHRLIDATGVVPVVNQIEVHPHYQQIDLRAVHAELGIATQSWSPLGQGTVIGDPVIAEIAAKHGKTPAQVILRWHIDLGCIVIPKSVTPSRIAENIAIFDFSLDADDLYRISTLDDPNGKIGPHPDKFN